MASSTPTMPLRSNNPFENLPHSESDQSPEFKDTEEMSPQRAQMANDEIIEENNESSPSVQDSSLAPINTEKSDLKKSSASNLEGQTPAFVHRLVAKEEELTEAEHEIEALKEKLADLKGEKSSLDSEIEKMKSANSKLTTKLRKTEKQMHTAEQRSHAVEQSLSEYKLEKEHIEQIKDMLEESRAQLQQDMQEKVEEFEKEIHSMQQELDDSVKKSVFDELQTRFNSMMAEKKKRETQLKKELAAMSAKSAQLADALSSSQAEFFSLQASSDKKMEELQDELTFTRSEKERREEELQKEISTLTAAKELLLTENLDLKKENYIFKSQADESKQQNFELMKEILSVKRDFADRELEAKEQFEALKKSKESVEFLFNELGSEHLALKAETQNKLHMISEERTSEQMRFNAELNKLKKELESQIESNNSLKDELKKKSDEAKKSQDAHKKTEKDLSMAESRHSAAANNSEMTMKKLRSQIDAQKSEVEGLTSEREILKKEIHKLENKIKKLAVKNEEHSARITTLEKEEGEYIKELEDVKARNTTLEFEKRQKDGVIKSLENRLKEQKSVTEEVVQEDKVLHWQYHDLEYQFNLAQSELKSVMTAKTELEIKVKSLTKSLESSRAELESVRKTADIYHSTIEELESKYRKAQEDLKSKVESSVNELSRQSSRTSVSTNATASSSAPSKKGYSFKWGQHMMLKQLISEKVREMTNSDEHKSEVVALN